MKKFCKTISIILTFVVMLSVVSSAQVSAAQLKKPSKVTASNVKKGVKIKWKKVKGAKNYIVMRKLTTDKKYTEVKKVKSTTTSFVDKKAKQGKTYQYKIKAVKNNKSTTSSAVKIVRLTTPQIKKTDDDFYMTFEWKKVKGAQKYEIYRGIIEDGKSYGFVKVNEVKRTYYVEYDFNSGFYEYKIKAICDNSTSEVSNVLKFDFMAKPNTDIFIKDDYSGVELNWEPIDFVDKYEVYRSSNQGQNGQLIATVMPEDFVEEKDILFGGEYIYYSYVDTEELVENAQYYYTLVAYDGDKTTKGCERIIYQSAKYYIEQGQTLTTLSEEFNENISLYKSVGVLVEYTLTVDDSNIITVDDNFVVTGVGVGKTNINVAMKVIYGSATDEAKIKVVEYVIPVKVFEAL